MEEYTLTQFIKDNTITVGIFAALVVILIYTEIQLRLRRFSDVKPVEAVRLMNKGNAVVLDVRSTQEYDKAHIINAVSAPMDKLESEIKKLSKNKEKPIITYCNTGQTSQRACKELEKNGFTAIHNLRGGITAWQRDGLPLNK